jgi:hypothetical protein
VGKLAVTARKLAVTPGKLAGQYPPECTGKLARVDATSTEKEKRVARFLAPDDSEAATYASSHGGR